MSYDTLNPDRYDYALLKEIKEGKWIKKTEASQKLDNLLHTHRFLFHSEHIRIIKEALELTEK